jgi:hypothetical protein
MCKQLSGLIALIALPAICSADLGGISAFATYTDAGASISCVGICNLSVTSNTLGGLTFTDPFTAILKGYTEATYGSLFATVEASLSPGFESTVSQQEYLAFLRDSASTAFGDTLTVFGGSGTGYISYVLDNAITCSTALGVGGCGFTIQQDAMPSQGEGCGHGAWTVNCGFTQFQTGFYSFTFGIPFTLSVIASISAEGEPGDTGAGGTVNVNLANIVVLNSNRQPIPFTISAQSGTVYPGQSPVPEPSSLALAATLVVLTGGMLRKRRKPRAS